MVYCGDYDRDVLKVLGLFLGCDDDGVDGVGLNLGGGSCLG